MSDLERREIVPANGADVSQEAMELHRRLLVALRHGDHQEALSLTRRLRLIYLDLWEAEVTT